MSGPEFNQNDADFERDQMLAEIKRLKAEVGALQEENIRLRGPAIKKESTLILNKPTGDVNARTI